MRPYNASDLKAAYMNRDDIHHRTGDNPKGRKAAAKAARKRARREGKAVAASIQ